MSVGIPADVAPEIEVAPGVEAVMVVGAQHLRTVIQECLKLTYSPDSIRVAPSACITTGVFTFT